MSHWIFKLRSRLVAFFFDISVIPIALFSAYYMAFDFHNMPVTVWHEIRSVVIPLIVLQTIIFCLFGLYRGVWRFASIPDLIRITKSVIAGMLCLMVLLFLTKHFLCNHNPQ